MTAGGPQWVGVVVGGLHTLTLWVDPTQCLAVVQQELLGAALSGRLVLDKRADLFVVVTF